MHKTLSISVFVTAVVIIESAFCNIKEGFLEAPTKTESSLENKVLNVLVNRTNLTLFPFLQFRVKVPLKNESISGIDLLNNLEQEVLSNEQKGKLCLKNITNCMEKDTEYHPTLDRLTQHIFSSVPPFDLSIIEGISSRCKKDSFQFMQDLKKFKLWALKMYDASAKLPSGFLNGNINQLGDFDMCLSVKSDRQDIKGQYCLASVQVETPDSPYLSAIHTLIQSHSAFKSKLEDPGHRVPRFSSINWALCVPHSCKAKDVELGLRKSLTTILNGTDLEVRFEVDPTMCQYANSKPIPWSTIIVSERYGANNNNKLLGDGKDALLGVGKTGSKVKKLHVTTNFVAPYQASRNLRREPNAYFCYSGFFAAIILTAVTAAIYDYYGGEKYELLLAFSLKKNILSLISLERSANDIEAVHGIRLLNAVMLLIAHKSMALFFIPYINRTQMSEILGKPWTVLARAASLYTDPFIMISGTLTAYSLFAKLQKTNKINIRQEYIARLLRIAPPFGALILFCTFVLPWISSGPQWNLVVTHHADNCKKYWWRNMLFIHNYYGFKDMCLTHTHHVGIDTQLFFVSPLMILSIWKWPKRGIFMLVTIAIISTIMRFYVTYTKQLSNYVHFGTSIEQLFNTADNMYILPAHRVTVYIMGILLGYLLHQCKNISLSAKQIHTGTTIALLGFCVSYFGPSFMGSLDYVYNPIDAACYAAFAPILWCSFFAWIIFTSHVGYKGIFGQLASMKILQISTRLSYAIYLTQFPIFFFNVGTTKAPKEYVLFPSTVNIAEIGFIIFFSILLTVFFDSPFQNIRNIVLKRKSKTKIKQIELEQKIK